MRYLWRIFLVTCLGAAGGLWAESAPKVRVLILSGQNNHNWRETTPELQKILTDSGRFAVEVTEHPEQCTAEAFRRCEVVLSNWNTFGPTAKVQEWPEQTRKDFLNFVHEGGGFVVVHAGGTMFADWDEFQHLIGAGWGKGTGHGARHVFEVKIIAPDHPVTKGMTSFTTMDELWHRMAAQPDKKVLATAFSAKDKGGTGADEPMVMVTEFGKGRCFNLVLGHDVTAMENPGFKMLLLRGTEWAATGKVTISAPIAATEEQVEAALKALATYRFGESRAALATVEQLVQAVAGDPAARQGLASKLAALLSSGATVEARQFACRQLSLIGGAPEVPALARLLADKELGLDARCALERIPGEEALAAMRSALGTSAGPMRIGLINSLAERRDVKAVPEIAKMLEAPAKASLPSQGSETSTLRRTTEPSQGESERAAAVDALGKIGGDEAAQALLKAEATVPAALRTAWAFALLRCADGMLTAGQTEKAAPIYTKLSAPDQPASIRAAAFPSQVACQKFGGSELVLQALGAGNRAMQVAAVRVLRETQDVVLVRAVLVRLDLFFPGVQAQVIPILSERAPTGALAAVTKAAASQDLSVRRAALTALGSLGDASTVPVLAKLIEKAEGDEKKIILDSLSRLCGEGVEEAMVTAMKTSAPAAQREMIRALVARGARSAVPELLAAAKDGDPEVRREAAAALGKLGDRSVSDRLIELLAGAPRTPRGDAGGDAGAAEQDRGALVSALAAICQREGNADWVIAALPKAAAPQKASLLAVLGAVGGDKALEAVRGAVKGDDPEVRVAAIKVLSDWSDAAPLDDLLAIASATGDMKCKALALRGVARLAPLSKDRPPEKLVALLTQAMAKAGRPEEKKALLSALGAVPSLTAMKTAETALQDPNLVAEAAAAVLQVAEAIYQTHRNQAREAVKRVTEVCKTPVVSQRAAAMMLKLDAPENLALGGTATSPDGIESDGAASGDQAAIDGNPATYWDEVNGQKLYRLRVQLKKPATVAVIRIMAYRQHDYAPKDFEVLCDDEVVKKVENAQYVENLLTVPLPPTQCSMVELRITGYHGLSPAIRELEIYGKPVEPPKQTAPAGTRGFQWEQGDTSFALLNDGRPVWRLNFDRKEGKPYFHPISLPDGTELTWLRPPDHPWHRALWWSWKLIGGLNYWEEDRKTGLSAGRTEIIAVKATTNKDWSAQIEMELSYHPSDLPPVLREKRILSVSAPDVAGCYRIAWEATFTAADQEVKLDRTPIKDQPGGVGHGGYAGLSVRMAEATRKWVFTNSEGATGASSIHGKSARWLDFAGKTAEGGEGGLAVFDHPENSRHPTPWYVSQGMPYFSPAFLFYEPYTLPAGESLTLRYGILVHTGPISADRLNKQWEDFAKS